MVRSFQGSSAGEGCGRAAPVSLNRSRVIAAFERFSWPFGLPWVSALSEARLCPSRPRPRSGCPARRILRLSDRSHHVRRFITGCDLNGGHPRPQLQRLSAIPDRKVAARRLRSSRITARYPSAVQPAPVRRVHLPATSCGRVSRCLHQPESLSHTQLLVQLVQQSGVAMVGLALQAPKRLGDIFQLSG